MAARTSGEKDPDVGAARQAGGAAGVDLFSFLFSAGRNAQKVADSCRAGEASAGAGTSRTNNNDGRRRQAGSCVDGEENQSGTNRTKGEQRITERESKEAARAPRPWLRGRRKKPEEEAGGGFEAARWHLARAAREKGDLSNRIRAHVVEVK